MSNHETSCQNVLKLNCNDSKTSATSWNTNINESGTMLGQISVLKTLNTIKKKYRSSSILKLASLLNHILFRAEFVGVEFGPILGTALPVSNSCQGSPNMTTTPFCFFIDILIFAFPAR